MRKSFKMENDIGIVVNYTVLGVTDDYIVFTNYMPADNEFGIRIMAGRIVSEDPFEVKRLSIQKEKEIVEEFKIELINTGKKTIRTK